VRVRGRCEPRALQSILRPRSLAFSDCEGYEYALLNLHDVPGLIDADILVELHDGGEPRRTDELIRRFEPTHSIERFELAPHVAADYTELEIFTPADRERAILEVRTPGQAWLFM